MRDKPIFRPTPKPKGTKRILVTLPADTAARIEKDATRLNLSQSEYMAQAIAFALAHMEDAPRNALSPNPPIHGKRETATGDTATTLPHGAAGE